MNGFLPLLIDLAAPAHGARPNAVRLTIDPLDARNTVRPRLNDVLRFDGLPGFVQFRTDAAWHVCPRGGESLAALAEAMRRCRERGQLATIHAHPAR